MAGPAAWALTRWAPAWAAARKCRVRRGLPKIAGPQASIAEVSGGVSNLGEVFMEDPISAFRKLAACLMGLDLAMLVARHVFVGAVARLCNIRTAARGALRCSPLGALASRQPGSNVVQSWFETVEMSPATE